MKIKNKYKIYSIQIIALFFSFYTNAQVGNWQETHRGALYFSVGYNKQWFASSTVHVNQGASNAYNIVNVTGTDLGAVNDPYSPMHYNFRLGYLLNYAQNIGIELCYDPYRYYIPDNTQVHLMGTFDGAKLNDYVMFSRRSGYYYDMRDGQGVILLNFLKRFGVYRKVSHKFSLDIIVKGGIGAVLPSVEYGLGNNTNNSSSSATDGLAGIEYSLEGGVKWTTHRHYYLELDYKYAMDNLTGIQIPNGTITQDINSQKVTLNMGYIFSVTKRNPMFSKGWPHRKEINHPRPMYHTEEDY